MSAGWTYPVAGGGGGVAVPDPTSLADNKWMKTEGGVWVATDAPSSGGGDLTALGALAPPASPSAEDEEFATNDGLAWVNQGSSTVQYTDSCMVITTPLATGGSGRFKALVGSDWVYRGRLWLQQGDLTGNAIFVLALRESSSGRLAGVGWARRGGPQTSITTAQFSAPGTFAGYTNNVDMVDTYAMHLPLLVEVRKSGSTLSYHWSLGLGGIFTQSVSESLVASFNTAPDEIGFLTFAASSVANTVGVASFLRKMS